MKFLLFTFLILLIATDYCFGQSGTASNAVRKKKKNTYVQSGLLSDMGTALTTTGTIILSTCSTNGASCPYGRYLVGIGAATSIVANRRNNEADNINPGPMEWDQPDLGCLADGSCFPNPDPGGNPDPTVTSPDDNGNPGGRGGNPNIPGGPPGLDDRSINHAKNLAREDFNRLKNALRNAGINPDDEAALQKASDRAQQIAKEMGITDPSELLTPEQKAQLEKSQKEAIARYGVSGVDSEGSGGGGGKMFASKYNDTALPDFSSLFKKDEVQAPSIDGLSKDFNGNPVGLAQGDIFKQVHNRYVQKQNGGAFLSEIPQRAPASINRRLKFK